MSTPPYRRKSIRLPVYDYAQPGYYFVTICTYNRECTLGQIRGIEMRLSPLGEIAEQCWRQIPDHFPFIALDAMTIMPNHVHGIVVIRSDDNGMPVSDPTDVSDQLGTRGPARKSVGSVVGSFKAAVSRDFNAVRGANSPGIWQKNYYEHVIRTDRSLDAIRAYIDGNPAAWDQDTENPFRS